MNRVFRYFRFFLWTSDKSASFCFRRFFVLFLVFSVRKFSIRRRRPRRHRVIESLSFRISKNREKNMNIRMRRWIYRMHREQCACTPHDINSIRIQNSGYVQPRVYVVVVVVTCECSGRNSISCVLRCVLKFHFSLEFWYERGSEHLCSQITSFFVFFFLFWHSFGVTPTTDFISYFPFCHLSLW